MILALVVLSLAGTPADVTGGDEAFLRIDYAAAIAAYEGQLHSHPDDADLLWRLARVYVCAGEVTEEDEGDEYFARAESFARRCLALAPAKAEGHIWLAAALGYRALNAGLREQVHLTNELSAEIEKALALDPDNDAAYSIRGSLYRALGNLSWVQRQLAELFVGEIPDGGFEEGEAALKTAIRLAPDVMRHHYELGVLYLDWGRTEDGRKALETAASLPVRVAIDRPRLAKIAELLASLHRMQN